MVQRLAVLFALVAMAFLASPLASMVCEPKMVARECAESIADPKCGDSGCQDDGAPFTCARCGNIVKMIVALVSKSETIRRVTPMIFFTCEPILMEGFPPSIDQPPRLA